MICRCLTCNTATNVSLRTGVKIEDYRCYCGGKLKKATITYLDGEHPIDQAKTQLGQYGERKGKPYFQAYKSASKHFVKSADKFIEIPVSLEH